MGYAEADSALARHQSQIMKTSDHPVPSPSKTEMKRLTMDEIREAAQVGIPTELRRPLRVLLVTPRYYPQMGGVETHVYETSSRLAAWGVDVTVLTTDTGGKLAANEDVNHVHIRRVRAWPTHSDYYFAPSIPRTIFESQWDLVHCQGIHTLVAPMAMLAASRAKIPFLVTFHTGGHSSRLRNAVRSMQWAALRPLLAQAEMLIAVSTFEADTFQRRLHLPADRFVVIRNGGQLPLIDPATALPPSLQQPKNQPLIVSIGRLERYKGHQRVLSALPHVQAEYPGARLLILGAGPYKTELEQLAKRLRVEESTEIRMIDPADRKAMAATVREADVVALLSEYEAHPIAAMEALALQRPVLVSDTSGLKELADAHLARAVALHSRPAELAQALIAQIQDPLIPEAFSIPTWQQCSRALLAMYERVVVGRGMGVA